ncbi:succinate dehydrogenase/fumarate reductase iron-sulfur subunit [Pseudodesulfovibrio hydrargyri]|uniref:Succinate dehydrogenase/fumarate reductase iron-sulfur subunit n=1 Tax=Pseudodesulfovibrio hydrargyri TaxID=2125990 RepID=A0A1J5N2Z7_9BACT|nr:(Fe-S)-binding protein [Pseudodesulfovibrio hydrargyri]OIQ49184.1 succinate dehydrogenase/fumarate reductase iron-sulfur subunit [Pseudodesulfovibrio hydrargyri]
MPEGKFCNKTPITTDEQLKATLGDKGGKQYYEEMNHLDVDSDKLWASIQKTMKSRTKTWLEICAHCGLCAESCFLYQVNGRVPEQVPSYKIQSTLGVMVKKKGKVDNEFMQMCMETAWSKCTCCNRCGMYCPHGIDMGVMFSYLRGLLYSQGFVPWELKIGSGMHRVYRAQMDVTTEDWVETCEWMAEENEEDWPGLEIPVDKEGADIMYTCNAREPKHYPEDIAEAAILFHVAGENWTVPSEGWEQTSLSMFAGDWECCKDNVLNVYAALERLKPKRAIGTECGHAHRATVIEGPYWAGRPDGQPPVPYIHYVEWLAEALREGKLKIDPAKRIKEPVTLQDSCNYVRNQGLKDVTREIISYIVEPGYFVEMAPNKEHNYCCGGGGGFNGIGKYREQRNVALRKKRDQILDTGCKLVIAPCHNCWDAIRDLEEEYEIGIRWSFLKPLVIGMLDVPKHLLPPEE